MSAITFDTHVIVKTLQNKGFQVEQAENLTDSPVVAGIAIPHGVKTPESSIRKLCLEFKTGTALLQRDIGLCATNIVPLVVRAFF